MVNRAFLIGNVGGNPEVRTASNGTQMAKFSLATSEVWKDDSGTKKEKTEWHRIVVFGQLAKVVESYVKKGSKLYLCGSIRTRKHVDPASNVEKYYTEVVLSGAGDVLKLLDTKSGDGVGNASHPEMAGDLPPSVDSSSSGSDSSLVVDDDIPF